MTAAQRGILLLTLVAWLTPVRALSADQPVSAFAADVGRGASTSDGGGSVTLYVVPAGRTLLLTDVLVANHGDTGPLYLSDSQHVRCSVQLLQTTMVNGQLPGLGTLSNVHESFTTGIPFGPGEPVVVSLANGAAGVDVTITGKLVPGPRLPSPAVRLPGGAREGNEGAADGDGGKP